MGSAVGAFSGFDWRLDSLPVGGRKGRFLWGRNVRNWAGFAASVGWIGCKIGPFWSLYSGFFFRAGGLEKEVGIFSILKRLPSAAAGMSGP